MNTPLPQWLIDRTLPGPGGCLIWQGSTSKGGYARSNSVAIHRQAYLEVIGPFDQSLEIDHLCRVPLCVNPFHLEPVTHLENMRRRYEMYTTCANGHEFTPQNTYVKPSGHRQCRACNRAAARRYATRKRGSAA